MIQETKLLNMADQQLGLHHKIINMWLDFVCYYTEYSFQNLDETVSFHFALLPLEKYKSISSPPNYGEIVGQSLFSSPCLAIMFQVGTIC